MDFLYLVKYNPSELIESKNENTSKPYYSCEKLKSFSTTRPSITLNEQTNELIEMEQTNELMTTVAVPQEEGVTITKPKKTTIKRPVKGLKLIVGGKKIEMKKMDSEIQIEMKKMDSEIQKAIVMRAVKMRSAFTTRGCLQYHYIVEYEADFVFKKGSDGIMRKVACEKIFKKAYRSFNDTYSNRYFDVLKCKTGGIQREGFATEHTTIAKQSKIKNGGGGGFFTGYKLEDLRAYMVDNGLTSTDARFLNYKQRVQWIMTADYDNHEGKIWKACLARLEKLVAQKTQKTEKKATPPAKKGKKALKEEVFKSKAEVSDDESDQSSEEDDDDC